MSTKSKILIVLLNVILILLFNLILPIRFEENDDVMMLLFSSGAYTGHPENVLVFINYLYGYILQVFYLLLPNYEWYTLFFLLFHIISASILSYEILRTKSEKITKAILLLIFYLIEIRLLFQLQFTTTAALLALSGLILITKKSKYFLIFGSMLFIIASLIRFEAAFLVFLIFTPQLLKKYFRGDKKLKIKISVMVCLIIGLTFGLKFIDYLHVRQNVEWRNYYEYNKVRGKINDNPNFEKTNFEKNLANKDDLYLLNHFFPDGKIMDIQKLNEISENVNDIDLSEKLLNIYPSLRQYTFILLIFSILVAVLMINTVKADRIFLLLHFIFFLGAISYVSINATLNYRVFLSALITLFYFFILYIPSVHLKLNVMFINLVWMFFFVTFANRTYKLWLQKDNWTKNEFKTQVNLITDFFSVNKKNQLIVFPADFSVEFFNALSTSTYFREKKIIYAGWLTNIPYNTSLKSHNNLINNSLFISKKKFNEKLPVLKRSIERNYHVELNVIVESELNNYMIVQLEDK